MLVAAVLPVVRPWRLLGHNRQQVLGQNGQRRSGDHVVKGIRRRS